MEIASCTMGTGRKDRPERDADPSPLLVPWSRKSRAIHLLRLWAVRPVQSLSACTGVHFTLPQCLYKGALYLFTLLDGDERSDSHPGHFTHRKQNPVPTEKQIQ